MKVSKAINLFLDYHKLNSQKKYGPGLRVALVKFRDHFPDRDLDSITSEEVLSFLTSLNGL